MSHDLDRPLTLTLAMLGGQGGGVVSSWLVNVAERENFHVQATSVPGVAQRTGATIYYLEFHPRQEGRPAPVMGLMPTPGISDILVASELLEAARMVERGIVNQRQTTLIASTHRAYTIGEKAVAGDGRTPSNQLLALARANAKRLVTLDMAQIAEHQGAVISAAVLGAIAGAGVLPFAVDAYRQAIRQAGIAVDGNLACFEAALRAAKDASMEAAPDSPPVIAESASAASAGSAGPGPSADGREPDLAKTPGDAAQPLPKPFLAQPLGSPPQPESVGKQRPPSQPQPEPVSAEALPEMPLSLNPDPKLSKPEPVAAETPPLPESLRRAVDGFPAPLQPSLRHCVQRLADYQDARYAAEFLERIGEILPLDDEQRGHRLAQAAAKGLALWMSFEDTIRVADLKTRRTRLERLRAEAALQPGQVMRVTEFLKPRVEEICGTLPRAIGAALLASAAGRKFIGKFTGPKQIVSTNVGGYLLLRGIAGLRFMRRRTLRYHQEQAAIGEWFDLVKKCARANYDLACEVALSQELASGYGDTFMRGQNNLNAVLAQARSALAEPNAAEQVRTMREAVLNGTPESANAAKPMPAAAGGGR